MTGGPITMAEVASRVEERYGIGVELRLRRTVTHYWVASVWAWSTWKMLAASDLKDSPEDAIRDLLRGPESR